MDKSFNLLNEINKGIDNSVINKIDQLAGKIDKLAGSGEKLSREKFKFNFDTSNVKKVEEATKIIDDSIDKLSKISNVDGKLKYFTTQEKALNELKLSWNAFIKDFNSGKLNAGNLTEKNTASTQVLRWANSFESLGGKLKDIDPQLESFANKMRSLMNEKNPNYQYTVDSLKEVFSVITNLQNAGVDTSFLTNGFKESKKQVAELLKFTEDAQTRLKEILNGTASTGNGTGTGTGTGNGTGTGANAEADAQSVEKLITLLTQLKEQVELIRTSFGTIDDESGLNVVAKSIQDINTYLSTTSTELQNVVQAISGIHLNVSIGSGGNPVQKMAQYGQSARVSIDQLKEAYDSLVGSMSNGGNDLTAALKGADSSVFSKVLDASDMIGSKSLSKQIDGYKQLITLLKELAVTKNIDISSWTSEYDSKINKSVESTQKMLTGESQIEEQSKQLLNLFGGKDVDLSGIISQLDTMIDKLRNISELLERGFNLNNSQENLNAKTRETTASIDKEKEALENLAKQKEIVTALKNDSQGWQNALLVLDKYLAELGKVASITRSIRTDNNGNQLISYKATDVEGNSRTVGLNGELIAQFDNVAKLSSAYKNLELAMDRIYAARKKIIQGDDSKKTEGELANAYKERENAIGKINLYEIEGIKNTEEQNRLLEKQRNLDQDLLVIETTRNQDNAFKTIINTLKELNQEQEKIRSFKWKNQQNGTNEFSESIKNAQDNVNTLIGTLRGFKFDDFFSSSSLKNLFPTADLGEIRNLKIFDTENLDHINQVLPLTENQINEIVSLIEKNVNIQEKIKFDTSKVASKEDASRIEEYNQLIDKMKQSLQNQYDLQNKIMSSSKTYDAASLNTSNEELLSETRNYAQLIEKIREFKDVIPDVEERIKELELIMKQSGTSQLQHTIDTLQDKANKLISAFETNNVSTKGFDLIRVNLDELRNSIANITDQNHLDEFINTLNVLKTTLKSQNNVDNLFNDIKNLTNQIVDKKIKLFDSSLTKSEIIQIEKEIDVLQNKLNEVYTKFGNSNGYKLLDSTQMSEMNNIWSKFGVNAEKSLSQFETQLSKAGILTDEIKEKIDFLRISLAQVNTEGNMSDWADNFTKIKSQFPKDLITEMSSVNKKIQGLFNNGADYTGYETQFTKINQLVQQYQNAMVVANNKDDATWQDASTDANKYRIEIENLIKTLNQVSSKQKSGWVTDTSTAGNITSLPQAKDRVMELAKTENYGKLIGEQYNKSYTELVQTFKSADGVFTKVRTSLDATGSSMQTLTTQTKGAIGLFGTFGSVVKKFAGYFTMYFTGYTMVTRFFSALRDGLNVLKDYDSALTTISYTMDITRAQLEGIGDSAVKTAKDLSTSLENAMSVYQVYANMQNTPENIAQQATPTLVLSNLTGESAATAADQIQAVIQAFEVGAEDYNHIADVYDKISSNIAVDYAKGIAGMAEGVEVAGQSAKIAGLSFEQLSSIVAKTMEQTRQAGSQIGNGLKTIMTRLSKVSEISDDVDNATLSNASKSLNAIGISVYNLDGSYREFDVIMSELADKWDALSDAEKSNISYNIAATRQTNTLSAILKNWSNSMDLATDATNANGNAMENQEKYQESYNGKLQQISTQMDEFWLKLFNASSTTKVLDFLIEATKQFNNLADAITPLGALLTTLGAAIMTVSTIKSGGRAKGRIEKFPTLLLVVIRKLIIEKIYNYFYER